jgi:hypothetical protein
VGQGSKQLEEQKEMGMGLKWNVGSEEARRKN